jgi:hypothetical protein
MPHVFGFGRTLEGFDAARLPVSRVDENRRQTLCRNSPDVDSDILSSLRPLGRKGKHMLRQVTLPLRSQAEQAFDAVITADRQYGQEDELIARMQIRSIRIMCLRAG